MQGKLQSSLDWLKKQQSKHEQRHLLWISIAKFKPSGRQLCQETH